MDWSKAGIVGAAALLLLVGGVRVIQQGGDGWVFLCAGFLMTGAWLAVNLHDKWHK